MRFMLLIPHTDLADKKPRVFVDSIDAACPNDATAFAENLAGDAHQLMDLIVEDWRSDDDLRHLEGSDLLREYGIVFGCIEIWSASRLVSFAETAFEP